MRKKLLIGFGVLVLGALAAIPGVRALLGIRTVEAGAEPLEVDGVYPHDLFDGVLRAAVSPEGFVRYDVLKTRQEDLRRYVATLGEVGPTTRPELFPKREHRLAWYVNAYNAAVLLGALEHLPLESVRDVRGRIDPHPGFGFFYALRFRLDGRDRDLHRLEQKDIRDFGDARIHAAVNCASASCPPLASLAFSPGNVDHALDTAARRWVASAPHVLIDEAGRRVVLSMIFQWYEGDFVAHAETLGGASGVLGWIANYATPARAELLKRAADEGWAVEYVPYDWTLNDAGRGPIVGMGTAEQVAPAR